MNKEGSELGSSSLEEQQPVEVDKFKHMDVEAFWNAYPLMLNGTHISASV